MHQRSSISVYKLMLSGHPLRRCSTPKSPFPTRPLSSCSNECFAHQNFHLKPQKPNLFLHPTSSNASTHFSIFNNVRQYSVETDKEVDQINLKFAEAREEIEAALESKETVYFDEEAECARYAVKEVLEMYDGLLQKLPDDERGAIQRSMGLKIEQLKAELEQLND